SLESSRDRVAAELRRGRTGRVFGALRPSLSALGRPQGVRPAGRDRPGPRAGCGVKIRRSELVVLASALVFAAILVVSFRPGRRPSAHPGSGPVPAGDAARGQATTMLDGFDFTEESSGRPLVRIKADRTIGYGPGAGLPPDLYSGEKVTLTLYPDD